MASNGALETAAAAIGIVAGTVTIVRALADDQFKEGIRTLLSVAAVVLFGGACVLGVARLRNDQSKRHGAGQPAQSQAVPSSVPAQQEDLQVPIVCDLALSNSANYFSTDGVLFVQVNKSLRQLVADSYAVGGLAAPSCFATLGQMSCAIVVFRGSNARYLYRGTGFVAISSADASVRSKSGGQYIGLTVDDVRASLPTSVHLVESTTGRDLDVVGNLHPDGARIRLIVSNDGHIDSVRIGLAPDIAGEPSC